MSTNACTEDDVVLSDVHVYTTFSRTKENYALSRFYFTTPSCNQGATSKQKSIPEEEKVEPLHDRDGDIVVRRMKDNGVEQNVITIEHSLATPIPSVGTQVWRGALLLCDFLIHYEKEFDGCVALELGGGVGLCSIVMGRVAKRVLCTDIQDILKVSEANRLRNCDLFKHLSSDNDVMVVRELDFFQSAFVLESASGENGWTTEDISDLERISVIMASDVIYDDGLTDAFLKAVEKLFDLSPTAVLYISLEKRINFTLQALDVVAPAYDYFMTKLEEMKKRDELAMKVEQLPTEFNQYFNYDRVKQLELWKIQRISSS